VNTKLLNEKIAESAMSWSAAFPDKKDVSRDIVKKCRASMDIARKDNIEPHEALTRLCENEGIDVRTFIERIESEIMSDLHVPEQVTEHVTEFEPSMVARVGESGNIYVGRKHVGKEAYIYFKR
jgi:putative transposon-encoded protein